MTNVSQPTHKGDRELALAAPSVLIGDPTKDGGEGMLDLGQIPSATIALGVSKAMGSDVGGQQLADQVFDRGARPEVTLTLNDMQGRLLAAFLSSALLPDFARSITAVDTAADTVTVTGDVTGLVSAGDAVTIDESTGNDGNYTIDSLSYDQGNDETTITVTGSIGDATADGDVVGFQDGMTLRTEDRAIQAPTLVVVPAGKEEHAVDKSGVWWFPAVTNTGAGDLVFEDAEGEDANNDYDVTLKSLRAKEDQEGTPLPDGAQKLFSLPPWKVPLGDGTIGLDWHLPGKYATDSSVALSL